MVEVWQLMLNEQNPAYDSATYNRDSSFPPRGTWVSSFFAFR